MTGEGVTREDERYVRGIDGLRAIAVLTVMLYHVHPAWMPGGFSGVDVFFAISGYVVTGSLYRHASAPAHEFLLGFYSRRLRRIYPALSVCLWATILGVVLFLPVSWLSDAVRTTSLSAFYGFSNFALLSTSDGYFAPRTEFNPFTHTWSLAVEEQFYLLFPLLLWTAWRLTRDRWARGAVWMLFVAMAASLAWCIVLSTSTPDRAYYTLMSRFWELASGALLFVATHERAPTVGRAWRSAAWIGIGAVMLAAIAADATRFPFPWALPAVGGTLLLIMAVRVDPHSLVARALSSRGMVQIGRWSYSLYLWHWPVLVGFRWTIGLERTSDAVMALLLTFALSVLSYALVEQPVLRSGPIGRLAPTVSVAIGAVLIVASVQVATRVYWRQFSLSRSVVMQRAVEWYPDADQRMPTAERAPCDVEVLDRTVDGALIETFSPVRCRGVSPSTRRLYVLGDSHAGAYARLLHMMAERDAMPVSIWRRGDCGVANLMNPLSAKPAVCQRFAEAALQAIGESAKAGDVIFLASLRTVRLGDQWTSFASTDVERAVSGADVVRAREAAFIDADRVVKTLQRTGAIVLLDAPKPVFPSPAFRCADRYTASNPVCTAGTTISQATLRRITGPVRESIARLRASNPDLVLWDPMPLLCATDPCRAVQQDHPMFFDGDHVSGYANELLYPSFREALRRLPLSRAPQSAM